MRNHYLVEIRLKDWAPTPVGLASRVVTYEEVDAADEYFARHSAFEQFETRARYEPILRRKLESYGITVRCCCAPDAVALD